MFKNPLSVAFGLVLKRQRDISGKTSDEVAKAIGIGASYYRLVESGTNNLHISKTLNLIKAFDGNFQLDAICKMLMAISHMEVTAKKLQHEAKDRKEDENNAYCNGLVKALLELSEFDEKLQKITSEFQKDKFFKSLSQLDNKGLEVKIENSNIVKMLSDFLLDYENFGKPVDQVQSDYLLDFLNDVPTIYFDFLSETKESLMRLPVRIGFAGLWQWEERNKMNFESFTCFTDNPESIVSINNLRRYRYSHLWEPQFREGRFIIQSSSNATSLKNDFNKYLNQSLIETGSSLQAKDFKRGVSKVKFKTIDDRSSYLIEIKKSLLGQDYDNPSYEKEYSAFWVFTMKNKNNVGFLAKIVNMGTSEESDYKVLEGISLTYKETLERLSLFEGIWSVI